MKNEKFDKGKTLLENALSFVLSASFAVAIIIVTVAILKVILVVLLLMTWSVFMLSTVKLAYMEHKDEDK